MFKYIKYTSKKQDNTTLTFRGGDEDVKVNYFNIDVVSVESAEEGKIDALVDAQPSDINCEEISKDEFKTLVENTPQVIRVRNRVRTTIENAVKAISDKYPAEERETWGTQLEEAKFYKDGGDEDDAPFLKVLSDAEGISLDDFADAVITNATNYKAFMAQAVAQKRTLEAELLAELGL